MQSQRETAWADGSACSNRRPAHGELLPSREYRSAILNASPKRDLLDPIGRVSQGRGQAPVLELLQVGRIDQLPIGPNDLIGVDRVGFNRKGADKKIGTNRYQLQVPDYADGRAKARAHPHQ